MFLMESLLAHGSGLGFGAGFGAGIGAGLIIGVLWAKKGVLAAKTINAKSS